MKYRSECLHIVAGIVLLVGVGMIIAGSVMLGIGLHKIHEANEISQESSSDSYSSASFYSSSQSTYPPTSPEVSSTSFYPTNELIFRSNISKMIQEAIDPDRIKENLIDFTQEPHQAGTEANYRVATAIEKKWIDSGLEDVHLVSYNVLLNYPDWENPNYVYIEHENGSVVFQSEGVSPAIILDEQNAPNAGLQWLAYSADGNATGPVVFCGYGRDEDFQYLLSMNITLDGVIALIRFGKGFRGNKVQNAQKYGAIGAILYSDPAESSKLGTSEEDVYPNTEYMPQHGVQRGTLYTGSGDALSPLYPAKPNLWKSQTLDEAKERGFVPKIPALPVSYTTAYQIMMLMDTTNEAPSSFSGGLNTTYYLGPGLIDGLELTIEVHSNFQNRTIQNVVGYIYGSEEPDRYVLLGNHYDAWVYGSMDPNAGTATLAEVARATMQVVNETGWRPARTLMFANWDAEEYGLIGSTEFVEEFGPILQRRTIAYLNMDCLKGNQTLYVQASPSLARVAFNAAKNVENPNEEELAANRSTAYDSWLYYYADENNPEIPFLDVPMGGSDQKSFLNYLGIPSMSFYWLRQGNALTYPLYHTLYETPWTNEYIIDTNDFSTHRALGQYWVEVAVQLADIAVIPYSFSTLAENIINYYVPDLANAAQKVNNSEYTYYGMEQLDFMLETADELLGTAWEWQNETQYEYDSDVLTRRRMNDKMINFEQCFVNPRGTNDDAKARHVLFSVNKDNSYAGEVMQQVYTVLNAINAATNYTELEELSRDFAQQISIVHYSLQCAMSSLKNSI